MKRQWIVRLRFCWAVWKITRAAPCLVVGAVERGAISFALGSGNRVGDRRVMKAFDAELVRLSASAPRES